MSIKDYQEYVESFGMFGEPVEYKGLNIYPILTQDLVGFYDRYDILDINKNKFGVEFIPMSYLLFLLRLMELDQKTLDKFLWIINKVLKIECNNDLVINDFPINTLLIKESENDDTLTYLVNGWEIAFEVKGNKVKLIIGDVILNSTGFNDLRKIILYQNIYGYDDTIVSEDVQRIVTQYYKLKNKGIKMPTFEDKMLAIISSSSETRETLKTMPCKQFEKLFEVVKNKTEYLATTPLIPHLKNPNIEHWIYKKEKNKYDGIFKDAESVGKKVVN